MADNQHLYHNHFHQLYSKISPERKIKEFLSSLFKILRVSTLKQRCQPKEHFLVKQFVKFEIGRNHKDFLRPCNVVCLQISRNRTTTKNNATFKTMLFV